MNIRIIRFITLCCLLTATTAFAQHTGLSRHEHEVKEGYNYWLYTPAYETETVAELAPGDSIETTATRDKRKPVIIFLHGASLCGNSLERVRRYGTIDAIEKGRDIDAYVIAPQNPGGSWNPRRIMNVLEHVRSQNPIDSTRIYVVGMSLGGYGTIDFVATYPDKVAAAMAFCGGGTVNDYDNLNQVPLWIVHGTADRAVNISQSDKVVKAMKASGGAPRLIYDRVPGWTHGSPARLFYLQESYEWLMSHCLNDDNRETATNSIIGSNLVSKAYQGLKSTKGKSGVKKTGKRTSRKKSSAKRKRQRKSRRR